MLNQPDSTHIDLCHTSMYDTTVTIESQLLECQVMLREIITHIESTKYEFDCQLASGVTTLKFIFESDPQVVELVDLCKDRAVAVFILGHMIELSTRPFDSQYRNPWEIAITTYLHVITQSRTDLNQASISAARLLKGGFYPERYIQAYLK
jgi:hypothetical protein